MSGNHSLVRDSQRDSQDLAERYAAVRGTSLALAAPLDPEDCVVQTMPEVSPTKWHLGHVSWFFERFCLLELAEKYEAYNEKFLQLFKVPASLRCVSQKGEPRQYSQIVFKTSFGETVLHSS